MTAAERIAVVVPAFNAATTLDATLASVAAQSLMPAAVVVADDHSADGTVDVAHEWTVRLPLEVVRLERNSGPAAARRAAIERTDAPLIALLDADDVWFPEHLAALMAIYERDGGIVATEGADGIATHGCVAIREGEAEMAGLQQTEPFKRPQRMDGFDGCATVVEGKLER